MKNEYSRADIVHMINALSSAYCRSRDIHRKGDKNRDEGLTLGHVQGYIAALVDIAKLVGAQFDGEVATLSEDVESR